VKTLPQIPKFYFSPGFIEVLTPYLKIYDGLFIDGSCYIESDYELSTDWEPVAKENHLRIEYDILRINPLILNLEFIFSPSDIEDNINVYADVTLLYIGHSDTICPEFKKELNSIFISSNLIGIEEDDYGWKGFRWEAEITLEGWFYMCSYILEVSDKIRELLS
jgi:hypothetical protein